MGSIVQAQPFQPPITGPLPGRDVQMQSVAENDDRPGMIADESAGNPHYFIPVSAPKIISQLAPFIVPASIDRLAFNLPTRELDWIAFYAPTAPPATLSVGPNVPIYQIVTAGLLVLPVSTAQYLISNTNVAAYTLYIQYGRGYPPPLYQKV